MPLSERDIRDIRYGAMTNYGQRHSRMFMTMIIWKMILWPWALVVVAVGGLGLAVHGWWVRTGGIALQPRLLLVAVGVLFAVLLAGAALRPRRGRRRRRRRR